MKKTLLTIAILTTFSLNAFALTTNEEIALNMYANSFLRDKGYSLEQRLLIVGGISIGKEILDSMQGKKADFSQIQVRISAQLAEELLSYLYDRATELLFKNEKGANNG